MRHYYAIAERGQDRTWWISFPGQDRIVSTADDVGDIVAQAQDALASAAANGGLPPAIEDGARPPADPSDFEPPTLIVVIPFVPAARKAA